MFLDEISDVRNWQKAIKSLVDSGELANSCVFLTGSHTLDVKYGLERLPGRIGKHGKDYLLLPLTFREFIDMVNPDISKKIGRIDTLSRESINKELKTTIPFERDLKILFNKYLLTGGFPLTINEFISSGQIPEYVYDLYSNWIIGDIVKWRKQERILKQVMRATILKQGTSISWDSLAKEAEIKSHKTISSYVEDLENMFVLSILYFMDLNKKIPVYGKNKKIYFYDPFIYHVFSRLTYFKTEVTPSLIEATCVTHLKRFLQTDSVYYWKNKREVDVVLKTNSLLAVEIKYQGRITREDWMPLFHFKKGILLTKEHLEDKGEHLAIPIHLFLSMV
ncbi:MAG: ATP-binding protein [Candidatus Altiarchaeota archaeon]|nr:ATP-binding protein [Candidatus Altiarchaeota archaeon]